MNKTEAIQMITDHIRIHRIGEYPHIKIREALDMSIKALENMGCGCSLCLSHNNMQCPKMNASNTPTELTSTNYPNGDIKHYEQK